MPTGRTFAPIKGRRMRVVRLDECGAPVVGPASVRVSKGFVSIALSPQYEDADAISVTNAAGEVEFNEQGDSTLTSMSAEITFTRVDPDLICMITGYQTVLDLQAAAVGFRMSGGVPILGGWSLEAWSDLGGQECAGGREYGYSLLPYLRGGKLGDFTLENGAASFSVSSSTREGSQWGVGPFDVAMTAGTAQAPLAGPLMDEIGAKDHYHLQVTTVAPPTETAGLVALAA